MRELGVTCKTAWRMFNLIRNQLMTDDDEPKLRERSRATVFAAVERGGRVKATVLPSRRGPGHTGGCRTSGCRATWGVPDR
jgi:hypothetical protein